MLEFANDKILIALLIIPLMLLIFYINRRLRKKSLNSYANEGKHSILLPEVSNSKPWVKHFLFICALSLLIIALAGPRVGSKLREVNKTGREIIIALDVSYSMLASDVSPNRLEMSKYAISRLFERLEDDKVGLIVFAGDAYIQIPLTNDYSVARMFLASAGPGSVSKQGTSISSAINLALKSFSPDMSESGEGVASKAIIIITDGEDHEAGIIEAANEAKKQGVVIHTIGIGDPGGVPVPVSPGSNNFRKDKEGNVVVSKLDEKTLQSISDLTDGFYVRAGKDATSLFRLMRRLDELEKKEFKVVMFEEYEERFQYFIGFALLLLLIEFFVSDTRNKWMLSHKFFK